MCLFMFKLIFFQGKAEGKNQGHHTPRFHFCMCMKKGRGQQNVANGFGGLTDVNVLSQGGENVDGMFSR